MIRAHVIALLAAAALLAGCGDGDVGEIRAWMEQVEGRTGSKVKPLPEPKTFSRIAYLPAWRARPVQPEQAAGRTGAHGAGEPQRQPA